MDWPDFLGYQGRLTRNEVVKFVRSLAPCIEHLTELDLYLILMHKGMLRRDQRIRGAKILRGLVHARSTAELKKAEDELFAGLQEKNGSHADQNIEEPIDLQELTSSDTSRQRTLDVIEAVKNVDRIIENKITKDCDDNTLLDFLVDGRIEMLWQEAMAAGDASTVLQRLSELTDGKYAQQIRQRFEQEYKSVLSLPIPDGYRALNAMGEPVQLNVMQRLTAYRLLQKKRIGNWSGVGTGKTNAATFAAAVIDAKMTLIIAANATLAGWRKTIVRAFEPKTIYVHDDEPRKFRFYPDRRNFVVVNYETFQREWTEDFINRLCQQAVIDFVVFDEVQYVRQRHTAESRISDRREKVNELIRCALDQNPGLHILAMSATPVVNNLTEAVNLLKLVRPEEDFSEVLVEGNIPNAICVHVLLKRHGIRFVPRYELQLERRIDPIDGREQLDQLSRLRAKHLLLMERTLLQVKLRHLRRWVRRGTLIYTHFVKGITDELKTMIEGMGLGVRLFTGKERTTVEDFVRDFHAGTADVLIGSAPVGTGVDGLQYVLNRIVFISLPWSHAEYEQIVGRLWRQGSAFEKVEVIIPQVILNDGLDNRWSWDEQRLRCIEFKETLADAAVDGIIPREGLPSWEVMQRRSLEALQKWVESANDGNRATPASPIPVRGSDAPAVSMNQPAGSMNYPLQHVSIRVPWHDGGWNGSVCHNPSANTACLKLGKIASAKNDQAEDELQGKSFAELLAQGTPLPPCMDEHASFMAGFSFVRNLPNRYRYSKFFQKTHGHFLPIECHYPAYSVGANPIRWFTRDLVFGNSRKRTSGLVDRYPLDDVREEREPDFEYGKKWIQDHGNQTALLNGFWNHVRPKESLIFFYATRIPLVEEDHRRALVGVGRVQALGPLMEYGRRDPTEGTLRSMLWDRVVTHSIRPDLSDGFLLPYHEALERSDGGREFDPAAAVAFAPDDHLLEFSYGTEHVTNDTAITALRLIRDALDRCSDLFGYEAADQELWIDCELGRLWRHRGAWPGLGAVLCANGIMLGNFMAEYLREKAGENQNPWAVWDHLLTTSDRSSIPKPLTRSINASIVALWVNMKPGRRAFLELLSRMELTADQVEMLSTSRNRQAKKIALTEEQMVDNPYLIYEATRLISDRISLGVVDRGVFPVVAMREKFPVSEPSTVKTAVDARRLRALTIQHLELAADDGHTLQPRADIAEALQCAQRSSDRSSMLAIAGPLTVAEDTLFRGEIRVVTMTDDSVAYQLQRLGEAGDQITRKVLKEAELERHSVAIDWRKCLDTFLDANNAPMPEDPQKREVEERARVEKTAALSELAASRLSILLGRAGTGKTTVLSVLCAQPQINQARVLFLAPTGKARVTMEKVARKAGGVNIQAKTIAGFLKPSGRYDLDSQRYRLLGQPGDMEFGTVVVDECSMLTEEMLAALIESFKRVDRLILVGDYRQLPPIGPGRPFFDIVGRLKPQSFDVGVPHVARGFAELLVPMRQGAINRDDLVFASWFEGGDAGAGDDQIFQILSGHRASDTLQFETWETPAELEALLPAVLGKVLNFGPELDDWQQFQKSLGGIQSSDGTIWFDHKQESKKGAGVAAESWQVLSPVRRNPWGVEALNRFIHSRFMSRQIEQAGKPGSSAGIPSPMGNEQIVYGDKVMNVVPWQVNQRRISPSQNESEYLANGEIGIVVGPRPTSNRDQHAIEVEFSTQPGRKITYYGSDFRDDDGSETKLELAYALTVHKSQGSEFGTVVLVLPRSPLMVTREMLYTALTRQKDKVVVLLQGTAIDLHRLRSGQNSATARRLTNLFVKQKPIQWSRVFLEEFLIHRTTRGELVRSKSEVIIANLLHANQVDYTYEQQLEIGGVPTGKFPDFTIEDADAGVTYCWEHLGMLGDAGYKRRWEDKERWYNSQGIFRWDVPEKSRRRLITTSDGARGDIDSAGIERLIRTVFR